jgi:hypothetical protein
MKSDRDCCMSLWDCTRAIDERSFHRIRNRLALDHAKWDARVGDSESLARFPLIIPASAWQELSRLAEGLASEAVEAEAELLRDPGAIGCLGLPRPISELFRQAAREGGQPTPPLARVIRFDFHPTSEGWRISEANTDVPGGYAESSEFARLVSEETADARPAGDPGGALARAILGPLGESPGIALISTPGYPEDLQVTAYLAGRLRQLGARPFLIQPDQIRWDRGQARAVGPWSGEPIDGIFRFCQGELASRGRRPDGWESYFIGGRTPVCNPGSALLVESKRFALAWPRLTTKLPTWRSLLPEIVDPRAIRGRERDGWVLKEAFCNTGDSVAWPGSAGGSRWEKALWRARLAPSRWVAQRRFEAIPLETPIGSMYPCLGVYTINGLASGIYGRLAHGPIIDHRAIEAAVLIREDPRPIPS